MLLLTNSWLGNEDHALESKLRQELPGILNWALEGLQRLTTTNRFTTVRATDDAIRQMRDLASPVRAFVREHCQLDSRYFIDVEQLFSDFKEWAENNGHPKTNKQLFGRDLRAAFPSITMSRLTANNGRRYRAYNGIRLRPFDQPEAEED